MRKIGGIQIWPVKAYGLVWYVLAAVILLLGCREQTAPEVNMQHIPTEAEYMANMKANGISYGSLGTCDPGTNGTVAEVNLCFIDLFRALALSGATIGTCHAAATAAAGAAAASGGSLAVPAAIGAWSFCGLGALGTIEGVGRWVENTQVGRWANQSSEEIVNRMKQAIYERMIREGKWIENAGCC